MTMAAVTVLFPAPAWATALLDFKVTGADGVHVHHQEGPGMLAIASKH